MGESSDNERLSVLEDCVRLSDGVEPAELTGCSGNGGRGACAPLSPCPPNMLEMPHLLGFLKSPVPRPFDTWCVVMSWILPLTISWMESSTGGLEGCSLSMGEVWTSID